MNLSFIFQKLENYVKFEAKKYYSKFFISVFCTESITDKVWKYTEKLFDCSHQVQWNFICFEEGLFVLKIKFYRLTYPKVPKYELLESYYVASSNETFHKFTKRIKLVYLIKKLGENFEWKYTSFLCYLVWKHVIQFYRE